MQTKNKYYGKIAVAVGDQMTSMNRKKKETETDIKDVMPWNFVLWKHKQRKIYTTTF